MARPAPVNLQLAPTFKADSASFISKWMAFASESFPTPIRTSRIAIPHIAPCTSSQSIFFGEGATVVVDATYNRELHRQELAAIRKTLETPAALIQCKAPLDVVLARFRSRPPGHAALDLTEDLVRELWTNFAYSKDGITIDTCPTLRCGPRPGGFSRTVGANAVTTQAGSTVSASTSALIDCCSK